MGNFRLSRLYRGFGVIIDMHILLNISLVGCRGKLKVLDFLLGLARRHFFKFIFIFRVLNIYLRNFRLLTGTSLGVL